VETEDMNLPKANPHQLKTCLAKSRIRLWQLRQLLPGKPAESHLSRMLNGIVPMDKDVEAAIERILANAGGES
jgi:hypothetical protein